MESSLQKKILTNTIWTFVGKFSYLIISLIANIVLARILGPEVFGKIAIILFFITIATVLTESGLSGALIKADKVEDSDYSTVFLFNIFISFIIVLIMYFSSSLIAEFYHDESLHSLIIASSLVLLINAFRMVQSTKLIRNLEFKKKYKYEFLSVIFASCIGVFLALMDFGIWSLIIMQISNSLILNVILWLNLGGMRIYKFDYNYFKSIYKFGFNTTLASLLSSIFDNIYQLILAKYFTIVQTGLYYQGKKLQEIPLGIFQTTILNVVYSALSKIKNKPEDFNRLYENIVRVFSIFIAIVCVLIYLYADFIICFLYGDKWLGSILYLKLLIIAGFFYLQEIFNRIIFKIFDRTEKILQLEVFKKIIQSISIYVGIVYMSVEYLLYGFILISIVSFIVNYFFSKKIREYHSTTGLFNILAIFVVSSIVIFLFESIKEYSRIETAYFLLYFPLICLVYLMLLFCCKLLKIDDLVKIKSLISKGR